MANKDIISDELLAAFLEGNTSKEETQRILQAMKTDKELQEVLSIALNTDKEIPLVYHPNSDSDDVLPMLQMAALGGENVCAVLCEIFILNQHHIIYNQESLFDTARNKGWLKPEGTPLYCLGNLLAFSGLLINRKFDSSLDDIRQAIAEDCDVMVGVDREKLYAEEIDLEDLTNHAVVVTDINETSVSIFDPYEAKNISKIPIADFLNAWNESHNYMIKVLHSVEDYEPHPIDVDSIPLNGDLEQLQDAIAENAHNVWAKARIKEGWTYGKEFDDEKKEDPTIMPYTALPDSEKEYDRLTAINTIKLVKKLGFDIIKRK
jgi:hypothetical protein